MRKVGLGNLILLAAVALFAGMLGFLIGSIVENRAIHKTIANIPDVDTIINCMVAEVLDNEPMIRSTIQFAAAGDNLEVSYDPTNPDEVRVVGTGFSSTEVEYNFLIYLNYDKLKTGWKVGYWKWGRWHELSDAFRGL